MRWLCRALLPAVNVAPTASLHTPFVDSSVSKKDTKEPLSWQVLFFATALQLPSRPVHRWQALLLSLGSFGAKSPSTIFLASWGKTRREIRLFFCAKLLLGKTGDFGMNSNLSLALSGKSHGQNRCFLASSSCSQTRF